jgi:hypothetical protein
MASTPFQPPQPPRRCWACWPTGRAAPPPSWPRRPGSAAPPAAKLLTTLAAQGRPVRGDPRRAVRRVLIRAEIDVGSPRRRYATLS